MTELHPLLPPCVRSAGPFSELYLAEVLPTLPSWRPGEELVREHQMLRQLFTTAGGAMELLPSVVARALEHLGHRPETPSGPYQPFLLKSADDTVLALALVTRRGDPLDKGARGRPNPMRLLEAELYARGISWGILTNGTLWRLLYLPSEGLPSPPYEVDPTDILEAPFFSEPFRYFSLFFRAQAFSTSFLTEVLQGSEAAWSASAQALLARAKAFYSRDGSREKLSLPRLCALSRALFGVLAAARGHKEAAEAVQKVRAGEEEAVAPLLSSPPPPSLELVPSLVAEAIRALTPSDPSDPGGLRDARLPEPAVLSEIVRTVAKERPLPAEVARALCRRLPLAPEASPWLIDVADVGGTYLLAALVELGRASFYAALASGQDQGSFAEHLRRAAGRVVGLSRHPWRTDVSRLSFALLGVSSEDISLRLKAGDLSQVSLSKLSSSPLSPPGQASLFTGLAQKGLLQARRQFSRRVPSWVLALADAWEAERAGVEIGGYEALLSLVPTPKKLLASPGIARATAWAKEKGILHRELHFPEVGEGFTIALCSPAPGEAKPESIIERGMRALRPGGSAFLLLPGNWTRRPSAASLRARLLKDAHLVEVIDALPEGEGAVLEKKAEEAAGAPSEEKGGLPVLSEEERQVGFLTLVWEEERGSLQKGEEVPEYAFREPEGSPWTPLRAPQAVSLAARIRARSYRLEELLRPGEPGQLFLGETRLSLQEGDGLSPHLLTVRELEPSYVVAAANSRLARYVLQVEGVSALSFLPVPRIHFATDLRRRLGEMKALRALLLAGRMQALLERVEQVIARGEEDVVHDLIAEIARSGRSGAEELIDRILYRFLGLSAREEELLAARVGAPPAVSALPRPVPPRPSGRSFDEDLKSALLRALRERGVLTSGEAQGITGLDSRRLRLLLGDMEIAGELRRSGRGRGTRYHPS